VTEICQRASLLAEEARRYRRVTSRAVDVDIDIGSGRRLTGTVSSIFGEQLVTVTYSKLDGKHLLESWIDLLALYSHAPQRQWSAVCIGRPRRGNTPRVEGLCCPDDAPQVVLKDLIAIYDAGRREPIPLPIKTSHAWAAARHSGDDPEREALFKWRSGKYPGEDQQPAHVRVWGRHAPLSALRQPIRPDETYPGETCRLGAYSARLWLPMLRSERGVDR
jgi:exodeoxyribonuclease V gamma subunit